MPSVLVGRGPFVTNGAVPCLLRGDLGVGIRSSEGEMRGKEWTCRDRKGIMNAMGKLKVHNMYCDPPRAKGVPRPLERKIVNDP